MTNDWQTRANILKDAVLALHKPGETAIAERRAAWIQTALFAPLVEKPRAATPAPAEAEGVEIPPDPTISPAGRFRFIGANLRGLHVPDGRIASTVIAERVLSCQGVSDLTLQPLFADVLLESYFYWLGRTDTFVECFLDAAGEMTLPTSDMPPSFIWVTFSPTGDMLRVDSLSYDNVWGLHVYVPPWTTDALGVSSLFEALVKGVVRAMSELQRASSVDPFRKRQIWARLACAKARTVKSSDPKTLSNEGVSSFLHRLLREQNLSLGSALELADKLTPEGPPNATIAKLERLARAIQSIGIWSALCGTEIIVLPIIVDSRQEASRPPSALTCIGRDETSIRDTISGLVAIARGFADFRFLLEWFSIDTVGWPSWAERFFRDQRGGKELKSALESTPSGETIRLGGLERRLIREEEPVDWPTRVAVCQTVAVAQELAGSVHEGQPSEYVFYVCPGYEAKQLTVVSEESFIVPWNKEAARHAASVLKANYAIFNVGSCAGYVDPLLAPGSFAVTRLVEREPQPKDGWIIRAGATGVSLLRSSRTADGGRARPIRLRWTRPRERMAEPPTWVDAWALREETAKLVRKALGRTGNWVNSFAEQLADCILEISDAPHLGCLLVLAPRVLNGKGKYWAHLLLDGARLNWCHGHSAETVDPRILRAMVVMDGATAIDTGSARRGALCCAIHFEPPGGARIDVDALPENVKELIRPGLGTRRRSTIAIAEYAKKKCWEVEVLCVSADGPIYHANRGAALELWFPRRTRPGE